MTVIAYDGRYVAADRMATVGSRLFTTTKLFKCGGKVLAICGDQSNGMAMVDWFGRGCDPKTLPRGDDDRWATLYVFEHNKPILAFEREAYPNIIHDKLFAGGTGSGIALGAMAMGASVERAVELASEMAEGCGRGVQVIDLEELSREQGCDPGACQAPSLGGAVVAPPG